MTNIPGFALCERTGKYQARRKLTEAQIIKAAQKLLEGRVRRGASLTSPSAVKQYLTTYYAEHKSETFLCLFLDNKHRLLKMEPMFNGTINGAAVYPREVARRCLELNAAAVFFAHNHPSGNNEPSHADRLITGRLKDAMDLVGVRALDHFVVGGPDVYSFAENGLM